MNMQIVYVYINQCKKKLQGGEIVHFQSVEISFSKDIIRKYI